MGGPRFEPVSVMVSLDDIVVEVWAMCYCIASLAGSDRIEHSKEIHAILPLQITASKTARNADDTEQHDLWRKALRMIYDCLISFCGQFCPGMKLCRSGERHDP